MKRDKRRAVSAVQFRRQFDEIVCDVKANGEPVAVTERGEIVGAFIGPDLHAAILSQDVRRILRERLSSHRPTIPHSEVMSQIRAGLRRARRRA